MFDYNMFVLVCGYTKLKLTRFGILATFEILHGKTFGEGPLYTIVLVLEITTVHSCYLD